MMSVKRVVQVSVGTAAVVAIGIGARLPVLGASTTSSAATAGGIGVNHVRHVAQTIAPGDFVFITARCKASEVATGGGYGGDSEAARITENSPSPFTSPTSWSVGALNENASSSIQVVAYVVCARA